jgi:hypothetical protein
MALYNKKNHWLFDLREREMFPVLSDTYPLLVGAVFGAAFGALGSHCLLRRRCQLPSAS